MKALRIAATLREAPPIPASGIFRPTKTPKTETDPRLLLEANDQREHPNKLFKTKVRLKVFKTTDDTAQLIENKRSKTEPPNKLFKIKGCNKKDVKNERTSQ